MPKSIQIRNVPDDLYRVLKVRAARVGMSLSGYVLRELERVAERPTLEELSDRIRRRTPVHLTEDPVKIIRRHRDAS